MRLSHPLGQDAGFGLVDVIATRRSALAGLIQAGSCSISVGVIAITKRNEGASRPPFTCQGVQSA